uniref:Uncharacterized protein n=1 Tax=Percolomonas cosmopolitus TaxID=63605 RepID=A0A7S1KQR4_9EUKA
MAVKFNVAAPEFHPTAVPPQNKGSAEAHDISDNYNATPVPSQQMRHNALAAGQHRMRRASLGRMESGASVSGPSMSSPSGSHIAPPSGLSETNTTRGPITIQPAGGSSRATGRGTSSTQSSAASQSMSRQDYLVKTIYHKLITCQSGDCRRRHSCIECLECNSLFCENCSNINLHALTLMEQPGAMDEFGAGGGSGGPLDEDDPLMGWDFLGTRGDLRQIPGYCPSCDRQECFSINLAMMKLLMKNDEYRKFAALLRRAHAGGMSAARKQQSGSFQRQNYGGSGGNKGLNATGTTKQHAAMKRRGSSNSIGGYKSVDDM